MVARWFAFALAELLLSAVAVLFAWLLALFAVTRDSHPYCSAKGPRQYLVGWLHLFSTHDDGVDAGWYQGLYDDRAPDGWPVQAREGSVVYRYALRIWWIVRNSCYGFAHYVFGFDRTGGSSSRYIVQKGMWDTATTNYSLRVDTNKAGRRAFELRGQFYFTRTRYVRVFLGWKLSWGATRVQIATHVNPFRVWKEAPTP